MALYFDKTGCECGWCSAIEEGGKRRDRGACIWSPYGLKPGYCEGDWKGSQIGRTPCGGDEDCQVLSTGCDRCVISSAGACEYCNSTKKCIPAGNSTSSACPSSDVGNVKNNCDKDTMTDCSKIRGCSSCVAQPSCYFCGYLALRGKQNATLLTQDDDYRFDGEAGYDDDDLFSYASLLTGSQLSEYFLINSTCKGDDVNSAMDRQGGGRGDIQTLKMKVDHAEYLNEAKRGDAKGRAGMEGGGDEVEFEKRVVNINGISQEAYIAYLDGLVYACVSNYSYCVLNQKQLLIAHTPPQPFTSIFSDASIPAVVAGLGVFSGLLVGFFIMSVCILIIARLLARKDRIEGVDDGGSVWSKGLRYWISGRYDKRKSGGKRKGKGEDGRSPSSRTLLRRGKRKMGTGGRQSDRAFDSFELETAPSRSSSVSLDESWRRASRAGLREAMMKENRESDGGFTTGSDGEEMRPYKGSGRFSSAISLATMEGGEHSGGEGSRRSSGVVLSDSDGSFFSPMKRRTMADHHLAGVEEEATEEAVGK
eukprot:CAMPEP_0113904284 /NCGR_PEP_ID=MMETSP0780_2-20120614/23126_1 /TAXON_ID=652834 /ORGANISM="Palpitomonas bilix" /LENGTH=534 /DNA_ID=CAMNT_0000897795 /DNA_START=414 /DNA_END=2018 /DNA_ORIENTATION=+ /assembly_acc=CAM_ASM_000599